MLRAIMGISARAISLAVRPQRAVGVTSARMRREDRSSISFLILSQTSAGNTKPLSGCLSRDSRIDRGMIQDGKLRGFAMSQAIPVRTNYTAGEVRRFAQRAKDAAQARRLLAIAAVLDGASREEAA